MGKNLALLWVIWLYPTEQVYWAVLRLLMGSSRKRKDMCYVLEICNGVFATMIVLMTRIYNTIG